MAFSSTLFKYYLNKDWLYHTKNSSSKLIKQILLESRRMTDAIISPLIQLFAKLFFIISVFIGLILIEPTITLFGIIIFTLSYVFVYYTVSSQLKKNDQSLTESSVKRTKILTESLSGIKDIIFNNNQELFAKEFEESNKKFAMSQALNGIISLGPKYIIEFIIFSSIISLIIFMLNFNSSSINDFLPILSIFALVAIKIIPSFQMVYGSLAKIKGNISSFHVLKNDLIESRKPIKENLVNTEQKFNFNKSIVFDDVFFSYPDEREKVIKGVNLEINKGEIVGFAGISGSGKSTILDLMVGFIEKDSGNILIDGKNINQINVQSFRNIIGLVQQDIFLLDGTIEENILFGQNTKDSTKQSIMDVVEIADLNDLIKKSPNGLETIVGERGVQLSGGQKQRIAIARAVYGHMNQILVFDEGTSALDGATEKKVINKITSIDDSPTIIMVAHRLSTLKRCDKIYIVNDGVISNVGTYDFLLNNDAVFKRMEQEDS